jgi:hypothetical protein
MESLEEIKKVLEKTLNAKFRIVDMNDTSGLGEDKKLFTKLIRKIEKLVQNEDKVYTDNKIDITTIVEPYWTLIEYVLDLHFTTEISDIIWWYIYNRKDENGKIQLWEDESGEEFKFNNPGDLYEYITQKYE